MDGGVKTFLYHERNRSSNNTEGVELFQSTSGIEISQVSEGNDHCLFLSRSGVVYSNGKGNRGQTGRGYHQKETYAHQVDLGKDPEGNKVISTQISVGSAHSLVLTKDGNIYGFGANENNQLGMEDCSDTTGPKIVSFKEKHGNWVSISCGGSYSIAATPHSLFMWGNLPFSQPLDKTLFRSLYEYSHPFSIVTNENHKIAQVSSGSTHILLLTSSGNVYSGGRFNCGQLGRDVGERILQSIKWGTEPSTELLSKPCIISVDCGYHHSCILDDHMNLYGWGKNTNKQLGNNPDIVRYPLTLCHSVDSFSCGGNSTVYYNMNRICYGTGQLFGESDWKRIKSTRGFSPGFLSVGPYTLWVNSYSTPFQYKMYSFPILYHRGDCTDSVYLLKSSTSDVTFSVDRLLLLCRSIFFRRWIDQQKVPSQRDAEESYGSESSVSFSIIGNILEFSVSVKVLYKALRFLLSGLFPSNIGIDQELRSLLTLWEMSIPRKELFKEPDGGCLVIGGECFTRVFISDILSWKKVSNEFLRAPYNFLHLTVEFDTQPLIRVPFPRFLLHSIEFFKRWTHFNTLSGSSKKNFSLDRDFLFGKVEKLSRLKKIEEAIEAVFKYEISCSVFRHEISVFRKAVNLEKGMNELKKVLENSKQPALVGSISHSYADKFNLSESLTNQSILSQLICLSHIGLTPENLETLMSWESLNSSIVLQFNSTETCHFSKKKILKDGKSTTTTSVFTPKGLVTKISSKVTNRWFDYLWKFKVDFSLIAIKKGGDAIPSTGEKKKKSKKQAEGSDIILFGHQTSGVLVTSTDDCPRAEKSVLDPIEVDITWILKTLRKCSDDFPAYGGFQPNFQLNRDTDLCITPRNNPDIRAAENSFTSFESFSSRVNNYLRALFPKNMDDSLFVPSMPLCGKENFLFSEQELTKIFDHQNKSIEEKLVNTGKLYEDKDMDSQTATFLILISHCVEINSHYLTSIDYIEYLTYIQLQTALGKIVTPSDFREYMDYHFRKFYQSEYLPLPFCHAVKRDEHHPDGVVTIEQIQGEVSQPIQVLTRTLADNHSMVFTLDATTEIEMAGSCLVHSWINYSFSGVVEGNQPNLYMRSGPYSSYIMMLGTLQGHNRFQPKYSVIVDSRDKELVVPLLMEQIPSPKAFKEATESLSPEQLAFVTAYRSMQLESTLFALCLVQIKPNLERLLNLPEESLTKEIELTEDIQELFLKYQIPSDLLSYDPDSSLEEDSTSIKVERVRTLVKEVHSMISGMKEETIEERKLKVLSDASESLSGVLLTESNEESPRRRTKDKKGGKRRKASKVLKKMVPGSSSKAKFSYTSSRGRSSKDSRSSGKSVPEEKINEQEKKLPAETKEWDDLTKFPSALDRAFDLLDTDNALSASIIKPSGQNWKRTIQSALKGPQTFSMTAEDIRVEKNRAGDLLDALSKSGDLVLENSIFHVVVASTHSFGEGLMNTLVKDNINPISKMEQSSLIISSVLHNLPTEQLVQPSKLEHLKDSFPHLFLP